jgi:hypothetical protein
VIYDDAGHTIPSARYGRSCDVFDVNDIIDVQAIAEAVWRLGRSGNQPVGSFGAFIDAANSSGESEADAAIRYAALSGSIGAIGAQTALLPAIDTDTSNLSSRLTPTRAANLDNLDVAVSSRAATLNPGDVWDVPVVGHALSGSFGELLDVPVSTRSSAIAVSALPTEAEIATAVWDEPAASHTSLGSFGRNLDARVSLVETESNANARELGLSSDIAGLESKIGVPVVTVSADISAVKAQTNATEGKVDDVKSQTDQLGFTGGNVNANAQLVSDKTGYALSSVAEASVVGKVWDEAVAGHATAGSTGKALSDAAAGASPASVADAVWDESRAAHVAVGSFGEALDAKITSRATQADLAAIVASVAAMELKVDQVINQTDAPAIENAVWDSSKSGHTGVGSFGESNQGNLTTGRAALLDNLSRLDVAVSTRADGTTAGDILADTNALELRLTAPRAANLDNLDAAVSSRATPITAPTASQIADAVWDEGLSGHVVAGSAGLKLGDLTQPPTAAAVAGAVWNELGAAHTGPGSFGSRLDGTVTSRASQTSLDDAKGAGFNTSTDSLEALRNKVDTLPASAGDATAANQATILASISSKASQSSVNSVSGLVSAIPTNPVLTTDPRLTNLDAAVSTRATESNVNSIKGVGFNPTTDTLEKIADAVAVGLDTSTILADLGQIKGAGFNSATDSLKQIAVKAVDAKLSADNAAANAAAAEAEAASKASQSSVDAIAASVALIPTDPVLVDDVRLDYLNASIDSRLPAADFNQILGPSFNPATDTLEDIRDAVSGLSFGDATQAKQDQILALVGTRATQTSVNGVASVVLGIPTNPLLTSDSRLANLDAPISSRADDAFLHSMAGTGFNPATDTLEQIKDAIPPEVDTITIMNELQTIKGSAFAPEVDDLHHINEVAKAERAIIIRDVETLLSNGGGV